MRFIALAAIVLGGSLGVGELQAERTGLPFTDQGLSVVKHRQKLSAETAATILAAAERVVRGSDPEKTQGRMLGDGGFASLQIWKGTVSLGAGLSHLSSWDEAGDVWQGLLSPLRASLPDGFIK